MPNEPDYMQEAAQPRQDLAQWCHDEAARAARLGESATTAESQDIHREYALNFTAIGRVLENLDTIRSDERAKVEAEVRERLLEHDAKADGALAMSRAYHDAASDFEQYEAAIHAAFAALDNTPTPEDEK
jgi:translation elongation factor EF-Tu-like GTPase